MKKQSTLSNIIHVLIKLGFIVILAAFLMLIYREDNVKKVNLKAMEISFVQDAGLKSEMKKASNRDLMEFMKLDATSYRQVIYYRNTRALAVEELLVVKTSSKDAAIALEDSVNRRITSQIDVYQSYGPEQVKLLKNAVINQKGNYLFYCTSAKADEYEEVFLNAIQ